MDEIIVVNRTCNLYHTKKVWLTNQAYSISAHGGKPVEVVPDGEACFGPVRVLVVDDYGPEVEAVYVTNPQALPFHLKVELYGIPPCPRDHYRLRENSGTYICVNCGAVITEEELIRNNPGLWVPPIACTERF